MRNAQDNESYLSTLYILPFTHFNTRGVGDAAAHRHQHNQRAWEETA